MNTNSDTPTATASPGVPERMSPAAMRASKSAFFGLFVDFFDIYLPIVALAPAMGYFQPDDLSKTANTTIFYATFALTLIARPIGSTYFGQLGDKIGRRRTTLIAIFGFSAATFLVACLPGHAATGWLGLSALIGLRFVGGFFMGGEYTGANSLALEATPLRKRGIVGGIIGAAYPCGYVAISIVTLVLLNVMPSEGPDSPYALWGWRIPFVAGALLGLVLFFYFRRTHESDIWLNEVKAQPRRSPLRALFTGANFRVLRQVFVLMSGLWLITQAIVSSVPGLLVSYLGQPSETVTYGVLVANIVLVLAYLVFAQLGQVAGRQRVLIGLGVGSATIAAAAFYGMVRNVETNGPAFVTFLLFTVAVAIGISPFALAHTYVIERFPTSVRASGYGIGYSTAIIIPSFYSLFMIGLGALMPYEYTPIVLIVIGGVLTVVGALLGRENKDVEMSEVN